MSFKLDLQAFADRTNAKANKVVRRIVFGVDQALVEKTPVGNPTLWANPSNKPPGYVGGRLRANWQYGENEAPAGQLYAPIVGPYPNAEESIQREMAKVALEAAGKRHYLVNNLPYAQAIEDGHSANQAPAGMVGITVTEFIPIVKAAAAEL